MFKNKVNPYVQVEGVLSFAYHNQVQSSPTLSQFLSKKFKKILFPRILKRNYLMKLLKHVTIYKIYIKIS